MLQTMAFAVSQIMPQAVATGLFVSVATFQSLTQVVVSGLPQDAYSDVAGLVAIPCMDAPLSFSPEQIAAMEAKSLQDILSKGLRHILLDKNYPGVIAGWAAGWRCVVDGVVYDVTGAEQDSQVSQTRVKLQLATVGS